MEEIRSRADVFLVVSTFYKTVKEDELLGSIFQYHIPENGWEAHLEKFTDFWVTALFRKPCFNGNPGAAHRNVDKKIDYNMSQVYFGKSHKKVYAMGK